MLGWHECSQLIQVAWHGAESKGALSVWSREARSSPEPRGSEAFCPRVSGDLVLAAPCGSVSAQINWVACRV